MRLAHVHLKAAHRTYLDRCDASMVHMRVACLFGLLRNHKVHLLIHLSCCAHCARKVACSIAVAVRVFSLVCLRPKGLQVSLSRCS